MIPYGFIVGAGPISHFDPVFFRVRNPAPMESLQRVKTLTGSSKLKGLLDDPCRSQHSCQRPRYNQNAQSARSNF